MHRSARAWGTKPTHCGAWETTIAERGRRGNHTVREQTHARLERLVSRHRQHLRHMAAGGFERLAGKGIECTVVNARFVKPLDSSLILDVARRTRRVVTVEENALCGGFGSLVDNLLKTAHISDLRLECMGLPDEFVTHGSQEILRAKYNLDADGITQQIISSFPDLIRFTQAKK